MLLPAHGNKDPVIIILSGSGGIEAIAVDSIAYSRNSRNSAGSKNGGNPTAAQSCFISVRVICSVFLRLLFFQKILGKSY